MMLGVTRLATAFKGRISAFRSNSTTAAGPSAVSHAPEAYSGAVQAMHWSMGGCVLGCFAYVNFAQQTKDKQLKTEYMFIHKSFGTLACMLLVPRVLVRVMSKSVGPVSPEAWVRFGANAGHAAMYGFLTLMPVTGVVMGYYGGNGLPFFTTTLPAAPADQLDKKLAGQAYKLHKQFGWYMEMLFLGHLGGVAFHALRGETILARILPIGGAAKAPKP